MFPVETYVQRRKGLREKLDSGIILFLGNEDSSMNYKANIYPFHQDASFLYYFGLEGPSLAAIIDIDNEQEMVFGDNLTVNDLVFTGPVPTISERSPACGITNTDNLAKLAEILKEAKDKQRNIHYIPQFRPENMLAIQRLLGIDANQVNDHVSVPLIKAIISQRMYKTDIEIQEIEKALDISYEMHILAMKLSQPGMYEYEVTGQLEGLAYAHNTRTTFPLIFSVHGEILHNPTHLNMMKDGDWVVHDSGVESPKHYCSDISRTFPVNGKFSPRQRDLYTIALNSLLKAVEMCQPGTIFRDVHKAAARVILSGLKDLGIIKGEVDDALAADAHTLFFPCGTGHNMGLDIHDMENLGEQYIGYNEQVKRSDKFGWCSLRMGRALEPGFVMTPEPGMYFMPQLMDMWKADNKCADFINYDKLESFRDAGGMRAEDDVLITADGYKVLGKPIPKTIDEIEAVCGS